MVRIFEVIITVKYDTDRGKPVSQGGIDSVKVEVQCKKAKAQCGKFIKVNNGFTLVEVIIVVAIIVVLIEYHTNFLINFKTY